MDRKRMGFHAQSEKKNRVKKSLPMKIAKLSSFAPKSKQVFYLCSAFTGLFTLHLVFAEDE